MKPAALLLLGMLNLGVHAADSVPLKLVSTVPLPGIKGRFDHFAIDAKGTRLFVAALGSRKNHVGGCGFIRVYAGGGRLGLRLRPMGKGTPPGV